jgi:dTDP-4-dehydrorhamnose reductase
MKILLIGKKGLLGQEIVQVFNNPDNAGVNAGNEFFAMGHQDFDITDKTAVKEILNDIKPNLVINTAAFTYVDECEVKKNFVMEVNGYANGNLADICGKLNAHLLYLSTDYVFDGKKRDGYKEDDEPSPVNTYGESKLLGEQLIQENTDKFFIIRTSWLFGMHGRNFVKTMLELSAEKNEITVVDDQFGKPTFTPDLAKGIYDFISKDKEKLPASGIYHMVNEGAVSWYEFAKNIFEIKGLKNKIIPVSTDKLSRPAKRPAFSVLLNTKLPKLRDHKEALREYLNLL